MKKLNTLLVVVLTTLSSTAQIINFPDANFKARLLAANNSNGIAINSFNQSFKIDSNNNGEIEESEALLVYKLNLNSYSYQVTSYISNVTGLAAFQNLRILKCSRNNLTQIDLLSLTFLEEFEASYNSLSTLDISNLVNLKKVLAHTNQLTSITQNNNSSLENIWLDDNLFTSFDVSVFLAMKYVTIANNNLSTLVLTGATNLTQLKCDGNQLTSLDFSSSNLITFLNVADNLLSSISISNLTALYLLEVNSNPITSLNVNGFNALSSVNISNTAISVFDGSQSSLNQLICINNSSITHINVRNSVISSSDPDLLYFAFRIYDNPNLESICTDDNEQNQLVYFTYNNSGNFQVFNGPNCDIPVEVNMGINDFENQSISLYPNPAKDILHLDSKNEIGVKTINIYNTLGQMVLVVTNPENNAVIDVANLKTGTYFIKVLTDKGTSNTKFIKE